MPDLPGRIDFFNIGRDYVLSRATRIDPAQVDVAGTDVNLFCGSVSVISDAVIKQLAFKAAALTLDGADNEDLDRLAFDRYQLVRKGASPALGQVRFFRTSAALGAGSVPIGTRLRTVAGIEYVTTTVASFGSSTLDGVLANVRAAQGGKAAQVGANAIQKVSQPSALWDPSVQVLNDAGTAGGEDAEDDDTFRARVRDFWNVARRGTLAAIEFGALTVPGVVSAQAIEATNPDGSAARIVNLYISDSSGVGNSQLAANVATALADFRAAGIQVIISTSLPLLVDVVLKLQFRAGVDTVALAQAVQAAVVDFINNLPVNGTLYLAQLYTVLQRFSDDGVINAASGIVSPVGDVVPGVGQTLRATPQNVTLT